MARVSNTSPGAGKQRHQTVAGCGNAVAGCDNSVRHHCAKSSRGWRCAPWNGPAGYCAHVVLRQSVSFALGSDDRERPRPTECWPEVGQCFMMGSWVLSPASWQTVTVELPRVRVSGSTVPMPLPLQLCKRAKRRRNQCVHVDRRSRRTCAVGVNLVHEHRARPNSFAALAQTCVEPSVRDRKMLQAVRCDRHSVCAPHAV